MEDGRELRLEVMRGRKEWSTVASTTVRLWMLSGPVWKVNINIETYIVDRTQKRIYPPANKDNIACQNLKSKYLKETRVDVVDVNQISTSSSVGIIFTSRFRTLTTRSLSPALFIEVIPSEAEMTFKLVHLERRWLNNTIVSNYIKVPSVYPGLLLIVQAKATGPLPISTYMRQCLS